MTEQQIIMNHLLKKLEKSKHLQEPGTSRRRVMLQTKKNDIPEYCQEISATKTLYNSAACELEKKGLIAISWLNSDKQILLELSLNLDTIGEAYALAERPQPNLEIKRISEMITTWLKDVSTPWILEWGHDLCSKMEKTLKLPAEYRSGDYLLQGLLKALVHYDSLKGASITRRAFSISCYHDSKKFEKEFQVAFLKVASGYHSEVKDHCPDSNTGRREQLAIMGIYTMAESCEMAGDFRIITETGHTNFGPFASTGIAIPSTAVNIIEGFDLSRIRQIIFIENKTNYDEYLCSLVVSGDLIVYHGGFFSPQRSKFFSKLTESARADTSFYFWGDIDLGGFQMFTLLQRTIPDLHPLHMSAADVEKYAAVGLQRKSKYLSRLRVAQETDEFPQFKDTIEIILRHGVTIEQEIFLV